MHAVLVERLNRRLLRQRESFVALIGDRRGHDSLMHAVRGALVGTWHAEHGGVLD